MSYSICLVPRGVRHSASNDLFATVMKDIRGSGAASIQAGSALMARGGICFTGDLRLHKKDKLDHLQSVLESRSTSVFIPGKKYGEDVNHQICIPVQSNFWSYVDSCPKKQGHRESTYIGQVDISVVPSNLLDAFGMFIYCDETSDNQSSLSLVHHNLQRAVSPETCIYPASQLYTTQDYERLIAFAKNIQVNMSKKSETLIHGYYLASRRVRTDTHGSTMPASALRHLMSMSEAHAKLSLRREVLDEDVLIAVLLFELSLTLKHGSSVFYVPPSALFPVKLYDESSLHQRDMYLSETYQQLQRFVFTYGPGTTVSASEE